MTNIRRLDGQGRVILPSHIREALGLKRDSEVTIDTTSDGTVVIRSAELRCALCGSDVNSRTRLTIDTRAGKRTLCTDCMNKVVEAVEPEEDEEE